MCEYCLLGKPIHNYSTPITTNEVIIRDGNKLYTQIGMSYFWKKINYCPMCGRKLGE